MIVKIHLHKRSTAVEQRRTVGRPFDLVYRDLTESVFREPEKNGDAVVVAVAAASLRAGSTFVVTSLAHAVSTHGGRTLVVSPHTLRQTLLRDDRDFEGYFDETAIPGVFQVRSELVTANSSGDGWALRQRSPRASSRTIGESLTRLSAHFDNIVVDCGAISRANDIATVARWCNGVVLVVEADRTRLDEIDHARMRIERVGGHLLGCVLNKRKYPIPGWLYRFLRS